MHTPPTDPAPAWPRLVLGISAVVITLTGVAVVASTPQDATMVSGGRADADSAVLALAATDVEGDEAPTGTTDGPGTAADTGPDGAKRKGRARPTTTTSAAHATPTSTPTLATVTSTVAAAPTASTSTATSTTTLPADACGERLRKADGSLWSCTFHDEFSGTSLDRTKWLPQVTPWTGYHSGVECFADFPENIGVADGELTLTVRDVGKEFHCGPKNGPGYRTRYTSGMVTTSDRFSQKYGRVEIRAKVVGATAPGLHSALWMWPAAQRQGAVGEIDIAELYSQYPDRAVPAIHHWNPVGPVVSNNHCFLDPSDYHDYVLEWTADRLLISYDGKVCVDHAIPTDSTHFDQPYFLLLTQALGIGTNEFQATTTPLPASTVIDHVRVWE